MEDLCSTPLERLEADPVAYSAWDATATARMLEVLAEWDRREGWAQWQCRSAQQWLSWKCGLGYVAASEHVRVAGALPPLPYIREAFSSGKLSYSKVRELTRVATPATDKALGELAEAATAMMVARMVSSLRKRTPRDAVKQVERRAMSWHTDDDGSIVLKIKLTTEDAQAVISAVNAAVTPQKGVSATQARADALVELVTRDGDDDVNRPDTIVHIEPDKVAFENGPAIPPEIAEMLACDGPVTTVIDTAAGPIPIAKDPAPTRAQRRALARLHRTCQVPGCDNVGRFDAHHVVERHLGGKTVMSNLVRLCRFHHRLVHLLGLQLTLHPDRRLEVRFPDGNPVERIIEFAPFVAPVPENPEWISSHWCGERLHLDYVHAAIDSCEQQVARTAAA